MTRVKKKHRAPIFYAYVTIYSVYLAGLLSGFLSNVPAVGFIFESLNSIAKSSGMSKLMSFVTITCVLYYYEKGKDLEDEDIKENKKQLKQQFEKDRREFNKMVEKPFKSFEEITDVVDDEDSIDAQFKILNSSVQSIKKKQEEGPPEEIEEQQEIEPNADEEQDNEADLDSSEESGDILFQEGQMRFF